jgi:hypothetical protein
MTNSLHKSIQASVLQFCRPDDRIANATVGTLRFGRSARSRSREERQMGGVLRYKNNAVLPVVLTKTCASALPQFVHPLQIQ